MMLVQISLKTFTSFYSLKLFESILKFIENILGVSLLCDITQ